MITSFNGRAVVASGWSRGRCGTPPSPPPSARQPNDHSYTLSLHSVGALSASIYPLKIKENNVFPTLLYVSKSFINGSVWVIDLPATASSGSSSSGVALSIFIVSCFSSRDHVLPLYWLSSVHSLATDCFIGANSSSAIAARLRV